MSSKGFILLNALLSPATKCTSYGDARNRGDPESTYCEKPLHMRFSSPTNWKESQLKVLKGAMYQDLDTKWREIRLLELLPSANDTVSCRLSYVSLDDEPVFTALSYVWGDPTITETITVNRQSFAITINLVAALRSVQKHWCDLYPERNAEDFRLWADAICIDQSNKDERSNQVQLMGSIYSGAELVLAWLCEDRPAITSAIDTIKTITMRTAGLVDDEILQLDWMRQEPSFYEESETAMFTPRWDDVDIFRSQTYWTRIWTYQELVLGRNIVFCSSSHYLTWDTATRAAAVLRTIRWASEKAELECPDFLRGKPWLVVSGKIPVLSTMDTIWIGRAIMAWRSAAQTHPAVKARYGWEIAFDGRHFNATDARDHIYGLLALSGIGIVPDYTAKVASVYVLFVSTWLKYAKNATTLGSSPACRQILSFLHFAGVSFNKNDIVLPTWVPNFPEWNQSLCRGVDKSTHVWASFSADLGCFGDDTDLPSVENEDLVVTCFHVGIIDVRVVLDVEDESLLAYIEDYVHRHHVYVGRIPPQQAFFRLIKRVRSEEISEDTLLYAVHLLSRIISKHLDGNSDVKMVLARLLGLLNIDATSYNFMSSDFGSKYFNHALVQGFFPEFNGPSRNWWYELMRVDDSKADAALANLTLDLAAHTVSRNRFFETEDGHLGLCPPEAISGDLVYMVHGCESPVILRKAGNGVHYVVVGTCHIAGLMNGEAVEYLKSGKQYERLYLR